MTDDLISRQAAIDALEREKTYCTAFRDGFAPINVFEKYNAGLTDGIKALKKLPSAQPERKKEKWIPVSEAMPEESDGTVLVCMPNKFPYNEKEPFVNAKHNRQVETATYSQYSDTWHFKNGGVTSVRPIAWMPLPKPWEGEE